MKTEVLLERLPDKRYRAKGSGRFALTVDGDTREEVLANFQRAVFHDVPEAAYIPATEVVTLDLPIHPNGDADRKREDPLARFAGIALNNPLYPMFLEQIQRNREADEAEENRKMAEEDGAERDPEGQSV